MLLSNNSVDVYLDRHAATRRARTIATLRERLRHATRAYGDVPLHELERMAGELADWQARLPARAGLVNVTRSVSSGVVRELGKTERSRRQVPLSSRAIAALDGLPIRLDTPFLFPAPSGGLLEYHNWYRREWRPALESSGVRPRRPYDLRSTFVSHALAAGVTVFELARIAGTSVAMIERHYGALLDGAGAGIAGRPDALELELEAAAEQRAEDV
jgi:hypothetical protein